MSNTEDWGPLVEIMEKIEDDREQQAEQAKLEEDYRHAEELATRALSHFDSMLDFYYVPGVSPLSPDELAALRFLTGIPRERK